MLKNTEEFPKDRIFVFRNAQGDLHDIKFEFNKASETVPDVVSEMVSASLIDERDSQAGTIVI